MAEMPYIDHDKCDCCGHCVEVCNCGAIQLIDSVITIIETDDCGWCTECEAICPIGAISCAFEIVFGEE